MLPQPSKLPYITNLLSVHRVRLFPDIGNWKTKTGEAGVTEGPEDAGEGRTREIRGVKWMRDVDAGAEGG